MIDLPTARSPRGYFILNDDAGGGVGTEPAALPAGTWTTPTVQGVSLRASLAQVQPTQGNFTWPFGPDIDNARANGLPIMLRLHTGMYGTGVPSWVYLAGVPSFAFAEGTAQYTTPIPWDPTWLSIWTEMVQAFGAKYAGYTIATLIQMAGLDTTGGEMHQPAYTQAQTAWLAAGYTEAKLLGAWQTVIDAYNAAFPSHYLGLDLSTAIFDDGLPTDVLAYAQDVIGSRLCVQSNDLCATTSSSAYQWVSGCKGRNVVGFQELCPVTPDGTFNDDGARFGGTLDTALQLGIAAGMQYLEAYPPDLENTDLTSTFLAYPLR